MRKIIAVAVLLSLSSCASGPGTRPLARPAGPIPPCPAYASAGASWLPEARVWRQALDSIVGTPEAQGRGTRSRPSNLEPGGMETRESFGATITHPARVRPEDGPQLARLLEQSYPPELRQAGHRGTVRVAMLIDARSAVRETRVARTSGYPALDAAALRVIRQFTFEPALAGTCSTPSIVLLPVRYYTTDRAPRT
jgi:protein TonB